MTSTNPPTATEFRLDINQIMKFLPHRAPFLFVDRVLEIEPKGNLKAPVPAEMVGTRVVAQKNVSFNEGYFPGHFPEFPIVPGVLLIETMAQTASFSVYPYICHDLEAFAKEFKCVLVGVDAVRFRRPVVPGDVLKIETSVNRCRGKLWGFGCLVTVDGQKVAEAEVLANLETGNFSFGPSGPWGKGN